MCMNKLQVVVFMVYIKLQVLDFAGVHYYGNTAEGIPQYKKTLNNSN